MARAIVLVIEFNGGAGDPAIVRDILGVTLGEACDAALVALILGDAASNSGLATARNVLKRVFAKGGVSTRSRSAANKISAALSLDSAASGIEEKWVDGQPIRFGRKALSVEKFHAIRCAKHCPVLR
jgi:hypothetical protein